MTILTHSRAGLRKSARRVPLNDILSLYRERKALARLDDAALADIGLTREEAMTEANRPIWDIFVR
ncbi:MAG: DUF1127 domain-containing protein [Pseudomonadota bacterium]